MKEFIVLSFNGQVGADEFDYGFVKAHNENDAYEIIDEEGIGYPVSFTTNCLIEITDSNIERFDKMLKEAKQKKK